MVDFETVKQEIEKFAAMLSNKNKIHSFSDAEEKAAQFLIAMSVVTQWKHYYSSLKINLLSIQNAVYAQELAASTGKTITENKINAEASKEYAKAREDLEDVENNLGYLKAYYEIFSAAHVFYRQTAKGEV